MTDLVKRIPFDSLTLSAVLWELQPFLDGVVNAISQPFQSTIGIEFGSAAGTGMLLISSDAQFARAYLSSRRLPNQHHPPPFCGALRSKLIGTTLVAAAQPNFDRILELEFSTAIGTHRLIAELMGKHSNIILVGPDSRVVAAIKPVGKSQSKRPVQQGLKYEPPPFPVKPPLIAASPGEDLRQFTGVSPFLATLLEKDSGTWDRLKQCVLLGEYSPVLVPDLGAYPISVEALGLKGFVRSSMSVALEQHYASAIPAHEADSLRSNLLSQLERVVLAREVALEDLRQAEDAAARANRTQELGELILAFGATIPPGASTLEAVDYSGEIIQIDLNPELSFAENANAYFSRARKAKARVSFVQDQVERLTRDKGQVEMLIEKVRAATLLRDLRALEEEARGKRYLHVQPIAKAKEDRPYQGHRVRELIGPGGVPILFGENAEANDYLMLRVAKPNDYWLHVRGNTSAHVVIVTRNQPDKIGREVLEYAARVAVRHSPLKHSGYVPVDYTLKKYVHRRHGAPKGSALYTHEKTIHVTTEEP